MSGTTVFLEGALFAMAAALGGGIFIFLVRLFRKRK